MTEEAQGTVGNGKGSPSSAGEGTGKALGKRLSQDAVEGSGGKGQEEHCRQWVRSGAMGSGAEGQLQAAGCC